jgi:hypothetical protein
MILFHAGMPPSASPFVLFNNLFAAPGVIFTASSSAAGFDPASVAAENTYQEWKAGSVSATLTVDLGSAKNLDTVALGANNFGTVGATVQIQYSLDGVSYSTLATSATLVRNWPLAVLSASPVSARYIRFNFDQAPLPSAAVVVGVAYAGLRLDFPGWLGPDFVRPADAITIEGQPSRSLEGHYLGAIIRRKAGRLSPRLSPLSRDWADANLAAFRAHYDELRPFFFAPGPAAFPNDLIYAWRGNGADELRPMILASGRSVSFSMELDFHAS